MTEIEALEKRMELKLGLLFNQVNEIKDRLLVLEDMRKGMIATYACLCNIERMLKTEREGPYELLE